MSSTCQNPIVNAYECVKAAPLWMKITLATGLGMGIAALAACCWRKSREGRRNRQRSTPYVKNYEPGVVYLFQFPRTSFVPSMSPFCLKLETWLRLADIPYRNVENIPRWLRSREGTLPFAELDGVEYPDSSLAITDLTAKLGKERMEDHMTVEQRAAARAMELLLEGSLLPTSAYFRMPHAKEIFRSFPPGSIPSLMVPVIARWWRGYLAKRLHYAGTSKHSEADIQRIAEGDLMALSAYLGREKHFFTGFKPTRLDATAFAILAQILYAPFDTPPKRFIEEHCANLRDFCERVRQRYWPDWEECTAQYRMNSDHWKNRVQQATEEKE